ncbi:uncharacterized protein LODBEIA_P10300 [Lodderomyces beijingensis]|uniref:Phosphoglycerate mutase n=1 Tax=Lodderomyces beijingensis TaxID=1775926 RepID=A0ABP0ZF60_9ASCO
MSLLVPNSNDHRDAHGDLEEDAKYRQLIQAQHRTSPGYWQFEPVQNFFKQSSMETDDMGFRYTADDFGALKAWGEILEELKQLNKASNSDNGTNIRYKLMFFARHGQGWANVAGRKYSRDEWYEKWRFLGTDGEITWGPDADLTELGVDQAWENHHAWRHQLSRGAPWPRSFYVSPLQRAIKTHNITWDHQPARVVENLRETIGLHLCHRRSNRSSLESRFPNLVFDDAVPEEDLVFDSYVRPHKESLSEQFVRVNGVLSEIFENDENDVICVTSHAGTIRSFITVIGHRKFTIPTGGMIPIVVRGEKIVNH